MQDLIQEILEEIVFSGYAPSKEELEEYHEEFDTDEIVDYILNNLDMIEDNISSARYELEN